MKKLNVLILAGDCRGGNMGSIYHYQKLGHNVYFPKPGTLPQYFNWNKIVTWPAMLAKNLDEPNKRNYQIYGINENPLFGEDYMLVTEKEHFDRTLYSEDVRCDYIDFESNNVPHIDAFHTSANVMTQLPKYLEFASKYITNAKWISSTFTPHDNLLDVKAKNIVRQLPANYDKAFSDRNVCDMYRAPFEFELVGVDRNVKYERNGFHSMCHNYAVRSPNEYRLMCQTNDILKKYSIEIINFGANIRAVGADERYSGNKGLTGNFITLNPQKAMKSYLSSNGHILLKNTDWHAGTMSHSAISGTPMVVLDYWLKNTHSYKHIIDNETAFVCSQQPEKIAEAVLTLHNDKEKAARMGAKLREIHDSIFNDQTYWDNWSKMLENLE